MTGRSLEGPRPIFGGRGLALFGLSILPSTALASDYTALFVWFVEFPIFGLSILFLLVCIGAPRVGLVLSATLLVGSFFIMGWAAQGYMDTAGGVLRLSLLFDVAGILIAIKKIKFTKKPEPDESA